jgi:hypothetical protein
LILKKQNLSRVNGLPGADRGEISPAVEARACFVEAMAIAKQRGNRSWELRAHISMDHLYTRLGNPDRTGLPESYSSFTEGHETADLMQAKKLLDAASFPGHDSRAANRERRLTMSVVVTQRLLRLSAPILS